MKYLIAASLILVTLIAPSSTFSQVRTGNLYGLVVDQARLPVPAVQVTLSGSLMAPLVSTTDSQGLFKFLSLPPSRDYKVQAVTKGFKPAVMEGIAIQTGSNVKLTIKLETGLIGEVITVTAEAPVVDSRKTTLSQVITKEVLQGLPTARDPWVVVQSVPSVTIDRENVGGNDSGQQSLFVIV